MLAEPSSLDWLAPWLVVAASLLLFLLLVPAYIGGIMLRLAVGYHNATTSAANAVPVPGRGKAIAIVFLATLFNVLVTWSYVRSFGPDERLPGARSHDLFNEEQEFPSDRAGFENPAQKIVQRAILVLRAFLYGFTLLILARLMLPTTPWRAFLVTGNYWLIWSAMLALVTFLLGIEVFLPNGR